MKKKPNFLRADDQIEKKWLSQKAIKEIIFSEGSYEIEVKDPKKKKSFFPFFQILDNGVVQDYFCSCKESQEKKTCPHLAIAYKKIFEKNEPLHVRFKKSFFYEIFFLIAQVLDFQLPKAMRFQKHMKILDDNKEVLFSIKLNKKTSLEKMKHIWNQQLEESSLKWSHMSFEEMELYKKKEASEELRYVLSPFIDLAGWLFLLVDDHKSYHAKFSLSSKGLPHQFTFTIEDLEWEFVLSEQFLAQLIPYLDRIQTNLILIEPKESLENIIFDDKAKKMILHQKEAIEEIDLSNALEIGSWYYIPKKGFYPKNLSPLLSKKVLEEHEIGLYLTQETALFQKYLKDLTVDTEPKHLQYQLSFDSQFNLHITSYVFESGEKSILFSPWIYIAKKGFFLLEDRPFEEKDKVIPFSQMNEFITTHKSWLENFAGFQTHFGAIDTRISYHITENQELVFEKEMGLELEEKKVCDFSQWIYIEDLGFYLKKEQNILFPIKSGEKIKKEEISHFIDQYKEALEQVPSFFSDYCPLEKSSIKVQVEEDEKIHLYPSYQLQRDLFEKKFIFFDSYLYVEGLGFAEIPAALKLPQNYQKETIISKKDESYFLKVELDQILPYVSHLDKQLRRPLHLSLQVKTIEKLSSFFYLVDLAYVSEYGQIPLYDIVDAFLAGKKHLFSKAGLIFLDEFRFQAFKSILKDKLVPETKKIYMTSLEWMRLCLFEEILYPQEKTLEAEQTKEILKQLLNFETSELLNIDLLQAKLRSYQEIGVKWLWFLYCHHLSGLLCDDMGLGKTHQAMALMASVKKTEKEAKFLIICPTSVIYHWEELLKRFLPSFKTLTYHGSARKIKGARKYDIILTSYGIYRADVDILKEMKFHLTIFDEIQIAKNLASKTHKALKEIHSNMKLGLTGTPIENRLLELKSLFDIVLPYLLPQDSVFKEYFLNPIEKNQDQQKQKILQKIIHPFILRRKKGDVLKDLPEKTEEIIYCDLSEEEKKIYKDLVSATKREFDQEVKKKDKPLSYVHVFSLLTRLKQACDHPSLILKDINYSKHESGKFELFVELLNEARDSSQKVVVFTQYLDMLAILEDYLKKNQIGYSLIKGSVKNRAEEIRRFREDPQCEVFLGSLLAAGVGIDLSAGSVVIHYDRWWNPAKENQATDRVHRIGQNRGVQVFKLVAKNTVDEHIHAMIEKKKHLLEKFVGKDDADNLKTLSKEELVDLFRKMDEDLKNIS
jgi:SNF2 family DNA or RNA helicase